MPSEPTAPNPARDGCVATTGMPVAAKSLLWFSPFGPNSDIGAFSRAVVHGLERQLAPLFTELTLVIETYGATYRPHVPFRWIEGFQPPADALCVFNIGNDKNNHRRINQLAMEQPGFVILHDVVLHDAMVWHHLQNLQDRSAYAAELALEGGIELARLALSDFLPRKERPPGRAWEREPLRSLPMLAPVLRRAQGVVVHSQFAARIARHYTQAPVLPLFLPCDQKRVYTPADLDKWHEQTRSASRLTVTSFGNLSRNKRVETVIRAFGASPRLRERGRLRIAGYPRDAGYVEELQGLINELGLHDVVELHQAVDERKLARFKNETDIFVLLRQPNIEGASGALVEALNTGRPVVVTASGAFDELPDDACRKISPQDEGEELARVLEELASDPDQRIALGTAGHAYQQRFTSDAYAAELLAFARDIADGPGHTVPGRGQDALDRLAATETPGTAAEIVCCSQLRQPRGSRLEAALRSALDRADIAERPLLLRSFLRLVEYLGGRQPLPPSRRMLAALADVVLLFGPVAFVELFWSSLSATSPGLTPTDAILDFRLDGPATWPDGSPRAKGPAALDLLRLTLEEPFETTDAGPWASQSLTSWHRPEATGTWSNGRYLVLPIARPDAAAGRFHLSVAINNFAGQPCSEAIASVDGERVAVQLRRQDKLRIADIPLSEPGDGRGWLVILDIGDAKRPSELRGSGDARLLGAKVAWLQLHAIDVASKAAAE